jgi:signal transduction histidine kinase
MQARTDELRAVSDAVLSVASQLDVDVVLQRLVDQARSLLGARYAALGIPDGEGGFSRFLVSGMDDELIAALGALPRQHGLLGAMLETSQPYRTLDIHQHPRFRGWWPAAHPDMRSFLGVPIVSADGVMGAFYLTDKVDGSPFSDADERLIGLLAAHAAIAITNARLYERSRELSILEERNRLALELHDVVSQKLFSLLLTAESAGVLLERGEDAGERVARVGQLARDALEELRSLVHELRPANLEQDGLQDALRKHVEVQRRVQGTSIDLVVHRPGGGSPPDPGRDREVLRIAQEALHNALRHAGASRIAVALNDRPSGHLSLEIADDGAGFDPDDGALRARRLGLTSMAERAQRIGARLDVASAPGEGTIIRLEVGDG